MRRCLNPLLHYAAIDQHVSVWLHKLNNRRCLLLNASLHFSMQSITKHIPDAVKQNLKPAHPRAMSCAQQRIQQGPRQPRPFPGDWRRRCWLREGDGHSSVRHCRLFASALPPWPQPLRQHRTQLVPLVTGCEPSDSGDVSSALFADREREQGRGEHLFFWRLILEVLMELRSSLLHQNEEKQQTKS